MTKALMFDLDNTLYSEGTGMERLVADRIDEIVASYLGVDPAQAHTVRKAAVKRFGTTLEWLMEEKGFTDIDRYFAAVHPEDEIECLSPDLRLRGILDGLAYPKIVLTNSPSEHADRVLATLGIADCFLAVYDIRSNFLVGKPAPEAYLRPLAAHGFDVKTTVFVDDHPKYVKGYLDIGGRGILKDETGRFAELGYERIKDLDELAAIL